MPRENAAKRGAEVEAAGEPGPGFSALCELLESDSWPPAAEPRLICDLSSEDDKRKRAEGILALMIDSELAGKSFLDFGCGLGHVCSAARAASARTVVGYDIAPQQGSPFAWEDPGSHFLLTSDFEKVRARAPYDVILLYDVLDHVPRGEWRRILDRIRSVAAPRARLYVRCHPPCSRHGAHLYRDLNKAFIQLVFTRAELELLGLRMAESAPISCDPLRVYRRYLPPSLQNRRWRPAVPLRRPARWIGGLAINAYRNIRSDLERAAKTVMYGAAPSVYERVSRQPIEQFFSDNPELKQRMLAALGMDRGAALPADRLGIVFVDYTVEL